MPEQVSSDTGSRFPAPGLNDFAVRIGTVNGTGSASANSLLMQAIFRMGIPVSGKNVFPSNIQGLPTWYEIRVSHEGWVARPGQIDLVVALNPETYRKDVAAVRPGGFLLYDSSWPLDDALVRDGITILGVPFGRMCVEAFEGDRNRTLLRNIAYAGALAALLAIDTDVVGVMLREKYARKPALLDANDKAFRLGYDYATANYRCPLPFHLERMDATRDWVLLDGNTAGALGAVYAGATVGAWYPITPSTSLMEAFKEFCERWRVDEATGQRRYCLIQAEDELAAAGMVIGAGWAGARAFTSTAGPGISLMSEFIGLAYYTEVPGVFFDVQRTGPSTGMPTRTQQGDLLSIAYLSHGDTKHVALFPASPDEFFHMAVRAFDLAERFQTPVFVVSDLDIGMNDWMCPRLQWDDAYRPDRGKVLDAAQLDRMERFYRFPSTELPMIRTTVLTLCLLALGGTSAQAATPAELAQGYGQRAGAPPSAARGEQFFNARHGREWSCASCHGTPPTQGGKHAATGKAIGALAPAFNADRFTDAAKAEKWFRRNCNDVVGRECTAGEKADVLAWLLTLKK
jgi:2-oxoglutarate ferredoxin oxidoreductase subunit alpha